MRVQFSSRPDYAHCVFMFCSAWAQNCPYGCPGFCRAGQLCIGEPRASTGAQGQLLFSLVMRCSLSSRRFSSFLPRALTPPHPNHTLSSWNIGSLGSKPVTSKTLPPPAVGRREQEEAPGQGESLPGYAQECSEPVAVCTVY